MADTKALKYATAFRRFDGRRMNAKEQTLMNRSSITEKQKGYLLVAAALLLLAWMLSGCAEIITAPLLIAEGIQESYDRKQTEKQEGHSYGMHPDPDIKQFEHTWLPAVYRETRPAGVIISADALDEPVEEWLWFEYFLKGKSPHAAARAVIYDFKHHETYFHGATHGQ